MMTNLPQRSNNPFSEGSADYAKHRPNYPMRLVELLAAGCESRDLAVDVGCGNGQLSGLLSHHFTRVIATDVSASQIKQATSHSAIDYRCEAAEAISVESGSVNLLVAAQAAHWFDLPTFYQEVIRVAAPNAVIALLAYGVLSIEGGLDKRFQRFYWQDIQRFWPAGRRHVETGYNDFEFPFQEQQLPKVSIERDWNLSQFIGYVNTWSATKNARREGAIAVIEAFEREFVDEWGDPHQTRRIRWPIVGRIGTV